ncbi:CoA transferase, partial [Streptomyces cellulosae]
GVTVVTVEQAVAAPYATRQLADLGARVIKVPDRPGPPLRRPGTRTPGARRVRARWRGAPRRRSRCRGTRRPPAARRT